MEFFPNLDVIPPEYKDFFARLKSGRLQTTNKSGKLTIRGDLSHTDDTATIFSNIPISQESQSKQSTLIRFVSECILDFINPSNTNTFQSFPILGLEGEDLEYFNKVSKEYSTTYDVTPRTVQTFDELLQKNKAVTETKDMPSYFDTMNKKEIYEILRERLSQLGSCLTNVKKSEGNKLYYSLEAAREASLVESLASASESDFPHILGEISDTFQLSRVLFNADYSEKAIDSLIDEFEKEENAQKRKYLATFLPIDLFIITDNNGEIIVTLKKDELKAFLINKGSNHQNIQQMILGYGIDLHQEIFKQYPQIVSSMALQFDPANNCGNLVDWSILYNMFTIFLYAQSNTKVFPIRFRVPKSASDSNDTFNLRYTTPIDLDLLFQSCTFIGVHLLKYKYKLRNGTYQSRLWFIFTFKILSSVDHRKTLSNLGYSYHSGERIYHMNVDLFLNLLEFDEIFKKQSITFKEFKSIFRYYGMRPYIIDNDTTNLFLTKLERGDSRLTNLCSRLNMKEVSIQGHNMGQQTRYSITIGGSRNNIIKVTFSKQLKMIDEPVWGVFYKQYLNIRMKSIKQINKTSIDNFAYPYFFTNEELQNKLFKTKPHKFNKYIPFTSQFYRCIEIFKIFLEKYLISNSDSIVTEIGSVPVLSEVLKYYNYKIGGLNFYNQYYTYMLNENNDKIENLEMLYKKIKDTYDFNFYNLNESVYSLIEDSNSIKQSNIISYSIYNLNFYNNTVMIDNYTNIINLFIGLLVGLKYLNHGGIFILSFNAIVNKATADIYLIAKKYFKKSALYYPEVANMTKRSGCYGIFTDYQGCSKEDYDKLYDILQNLKKTYPTYPKDFNIDDKQIIDMYELYNNNKQTKKKRTSQNINKYIYSFLDLPETSDEYQEIIDFNNNRYIKQLEFLKKLTEIMKLPENELPKLPTQEQITYSIMYCKKWGIEYFPYYYDSKVMNDKMGQQILTEIYGNIEPISYKFKTSLPRLTQKNSLRKTKKTMKSKKISEFHSLNLNFMQEITNINNLMVQTGYMIDSRRDFDVKDPKHQLYNYFMANVLFRFYKSSGKEIENNLAFMVRDKIQRNVSQAWLKLYEILAETNIISKQKTTYKTFHLCEAPGSFIDCLDYFIKKETNVKQFIWNAQSHKPTKGKTYFGDDYGIIKGYPNRWHWGKDGDGDITSCNNIFSYKELCKDIDLITSDCGLPMNEPGYHRVLFSSMVAITYLLPKGGDMIFKILLPIDIPIIWNIIYLWFNNFKEFMFFKPVQNHQSREFYIIGKKYSGKLENSKIMTQLLNLVKDSRDTFMTVDLFDNNYSELFTSQMIDISQKLCDNWTFTIQKQIYYSDNMDSLDKSFKTKAKAFINQKNLDFIEKYNLVKIEK